jgi:cathepsin F
MNIGVIVLALLTVSGTVTYLYKNSNAGNAEQQFRQYMKQYGKTYATEQEYQTRFTNFKNNMMRNVELGRKHTLASFGINKFSDMSVAEFKQTLLMPAFDANQSCIFPYHRYSRPAKMDIPSTFDWRTKGAVTDIKNQGSCGSCWTFSTAENIEGQWFLAGHSLTSLSEQWIVDCSHGCLQSEPDVCDSGCGGGLPWLAYQDIITNGGLTSEADYPYNGNQNNCPSSEPSIAKISNWTALDTDPTDIETYMAAKGPLSIALNADLLMSYTGGVITGNMPDDCPVDGMDHAVLMVGYDLTKSQASVPFWIVKNSWGSDWGENGYFRMESDNGLCGINLCVTSALV